MNLDMTYLSIQRTKMANLNTYLSYIRTGFAISAIAGNLKKIYIFLFGIIIILVSTYQYWYINDKLEKNEEVTTKMFETIPLIYMGLSIVVLLLQFNLIK
jgi:uncharacterized membrane protein YidH (DUF202 family)